jgi:hypothetical protein
VLEENVYDCSMLGVGISATDKGGEDMEALKEKLIAAGFRSYNPEVSAPQLGSPPVQR